MNMNVFVTNNYIDTTGEGPSLKSVLATNSIHYVICPDGSVLTEKHGRILDSLPSCKVSPATKGLKPMNVVGIGVLSKAASSIQSVITGKMKMNFFGYNTGAESHKELTPRQFNKKHSVLFFSLEELTAASLELTIRLLTIEMAGEEAQKDWTWQQISAVPTYMTRPMSTKEKSLASICSARPVVSFVDEIKITMDFSEEKSRYFMMTMDGHTKEVAYSEALPFIRLYKEDKYFAVSAKGIPLMEVAIIADPKSCRLSAIVATLQKYPGLSLFCRTYGKQAKRLARIFFRKNMKSFQKFEAPTKALGITNNLMKLALQATAFDTSSYRFFSYFLSLWENKNPQVVESILSEYMNCYEKMLNSEGDGEDETGSYDSRSECFLGAASTISDIIDVYGGPSGKDYNFRRLLVYLSEDVYIYQGISSAFEAATLLRDYYHCMSQMGIKINDWFPKSLKLAHDMAVKNHSVVISEQRQKRFAEVVKDPAYQNLTYADKDWVVLAPTESKDLVTEGRRQSHCVGSYVDYVVNKQKFILFMRQADNPETPVITLDVDPKEHSLVQYRGFANRSPDEDEMKFIKKWAKEKGLKVM